MIDVHRAMNTFDYDETDECMRDWTSLLLACLPPCPFVPVADPFWCHFDSAVPGDDVGV